MVDGRGSAEDPVDREFEEVEALLRRDVDPSDWGFFRTELDRAAPYVQERTGQLLARIQRAMLFLAKGDRNEIVAVRELADLDWRDVLANAEYSDDSDRIDRWRRGPS